MTREALIERFNKKDKSGHLKAFLYGFLLAFVVFAPFMIVDKGYFLYYGDFNVQQIPFYQMCHDAILSGNIKWSHTTDLGANFIGSYTFYLLGSPFFYLTLLFPSKAVPYLMGPLFMLKFGCASLAGYTYLKRYVRTRKTAYIGAILYAFSGYSVYNVFFNHFHEAIIIFPFLLYSVDEYMYKRRRGLFAFCVFASCFMNYYFFVGQVVFTLIYFFVGLLSGRWRLSLRDFILMFVEAVLGLLMSCVLLIPSIFAVLQNPRVDNAFNGWNALLYNVNQRYVHILQCLFFPPDIPARPNFTPDSQSKWASLGAWLPLFSMTGVIGWFTLRRKHWLKKMIAILFFMAFIPVLNSSFQLFNSSFYARWYYMLTLMMILATVLALENAKVDWNKAISWTTSITILMAGAIGLMPHESNDLKDLDGNPVTVYGLEEYPSRFWSYVAITLFCLLLLSFLFVFYKKNKEKFLRYTFVSCTFISVIYSIFVLSLGKTQTAIASEHLIPYALNGGEDLEVEITDNMRVDFYESLDNSAMFWQVPSIQAFQSIVPGSIMEFYPSINVTRDVGSRADTTHYALRGFTSCKYLFDALDDNEHFGGKDKNEPEMVGWKYISTENGFDVWENEYYIPMGFFYRYYITPEEYEELTKYKRELSLLKALVMTDAQAAKYEGAIEHIEPSSLIFDEGNYTKDCAILQKCASSSFEYDNDGFTCEITTDASRMVFFSVPYEPGWSAYVNGEKAELEKVSVGFMAVNVPKGENTIRFEYETPGLSVGVAVTLVSAFIFIVYLILAKRLNIDKNFRGIKVTLKKKGV